MENILGRQLWNVYENLKRDKRIGFLRMMNFKSIS